MKKEVTISKLKETSQQQKKQDYVPVGVMDVQRKLEESLPAMQLDAIKKIGHAIGTVGLTIDDACLYARVDRDELDEWIDVCPEINTYFKLKRTDYKYYLLDIIHSQAREDRDMKTAVWLLEQHFSSDYNTQLKKEAEKAKMDSGEDVMYAAIALVRKTNSQEVPVEEQNQQRAEEARKVEYESLDEILE